MGISVTTLALAKKYTKDSLIGLGAIKGAPCTITNVIENPNEILVTFGWEDVNGGSKSTTITIPTGADGKSLEYEWDGTKLGIKVEGEDNFTYTDLKGEDGFSPSVKITKEPNKAVLEVADKNGTTSAEVFTYTVSDVKPTTAGLVGEMVINSLPEPGGNVGWIYTPIGWYAFGLIAKDEFDTFILADGTKFSLADGTAFFVKGS